MANIKYTIQEEIATLSVNSKGWIKQLNLVSWNDTNPKFDIRTWDDTHSKMGKGVTLSEEEMRKLYESLQTYFGEGEMVETPQKPNIEERFEQLQMHAPLFIQELKNILEYMEEQELSILEKRALLTQSTEAPQILPVMNEIESLSTIYQGFYNEYKSIILEADDKQMTRLVLF
ncbi:hypothetical protein KJK41_04295 [Bacillus haikouensis]|nr:hypothetical protein KJK41_04295 [Bacillus haikouensis]